MENGLALNSSAPFLTQKITALFIFGRQFKQFVSSFAEASIQRADRIR
jgi:hypothetical protein